MKLQTNCSFIYLVDDLHVNIITSGYSIDSAALNHLLFTQNLKYFPFLCIFVSCQKINLGAQWVWQLT